jgi:hypothetical protein
MSKFLKHPFVDRINDVLKPKKQKKKTNLLVIYFSKLVYVILKFCFLLSICEHFYLQPQEIGRPSPTANFVKHFLMLTYLVVDLLTTTKKKKEIGGQDKL